MTLLNLSKNRSNCSEKLLSLLLIRDVCIFLTLRNAFDCSTVALEGLLREFSGDLALFRCVLLSLVLSSSFGLSSTGIDAILRGTSLSVSL